MADGLSVRAFAQRLGVSHVAVLKAIKGGRLSSSVRLNAKGKAVIVDEAVARQEWAANAGRPTKPAAVHGATSDAVTVTAVTEPVTATTLTEAQRIATVERARKLRLENDTREQRYVPVAKTRREAFEAARLIRDSLLNIPARLSGELAADTDAAVVFRKLDAAIRQALSTLADDLEATVH